jgi:hypothetical protein
VSRSGFTPEGRTKASANNIETRTLEEALETDWPEEFARLGVVKLTFRPILQDVYVETEPQLTNAVEMSSTVTDDQGNIHGALREVALDCFQRKIQVDTREYVNRNFLGMFKTLEELQGKAMLFGEMVSRPAAAKAARRRAGERPRSRSSLITGEGEGGDRRAAKAQGLHLLSSQWRERCR